MIFTPVDNQQQFSVGKLLAALPRQKLNHAISLCKINQSGAEIESVKSLDAFVLASVF
jgi:hypothetical protein